jgi:iron complex outermembrane recepter protein
MSWHVNGSASISGSILVVLLVLSGPSAAIAQIDTGITLSGQLLHSVTLHPIPDVVVAVEELRRETRSDGNGRFAFENVPPGEYHVSVRAEGFTSRRTEVRVAAEPVTLDLRVDPELHYTEVVSVSPDARSAFDAYQPTSVLAGQDLARELGVSLGETLARQPGVAERALGPAPSRPVIRGLDGDRVLILEDGQRMGDLSSQSGDHGVMVNPATASRVEVVRGPATLLYGTNALGGLVNVITERIPTAPVTGVRGGMTLDVGTAATQAGGAGDVRWGNGAWALHASGSGRRSGDVDTPQGPIDNSQARYADGSFGAAWTGSRVYIGSSYGYDDGKYGVPVVEEGNVEITPRRQQFSLRSGGHGFGGVFESYRATFGYRKYTHDELEAGQVATTFHNDTAELEVLGAHRPAARLSGTIGGSFLDRDFSATGAEALSPPVGQQATAAFVYEELKWPHITLQFGGRLDYTRFRPEGGLPLREFTNISGSVGVLYRPAAAHDHITLAVSLARAARNPALEELYFFGPHAGNFSFEIGNPALGSEKGLGFDASLRWQSRRLSGEVTYFRNDIRDYIFRRPVSQEEFDERFGQGIDEEGEEAGFPFIEFTAADSVLQGVEAHTDVQLTGWLFAEISLDYVRGTLKDPGEPLPRIPPLRARGGLRYQRNALQAGGEIVAAAQQDRTFPDVETPTDGYALLRLFGAYSFGSGQQVNTITARLDNATNELYRNHLSYIKDVAPEMGRNFRLLYSLKF